MVSVIAGIPALIESGETFTYDNFAHMSPRGFPNAFREDWLVWEHQVAQVMDAIDSSRIASAIKFGLDASLLGNDNDAFTSAHNSIMSGLKAAHKVYGLAIPAADRTVTLGHNSPEQQEALQKLDELVAAVEATNDFPGDADDKELVVAELSAGRRLLQAANVRVAAVRETLQPALKWILEKGAGAAIGKLAGDLLEYLVHLKFW